MNIETGIAVEILELWHISRTALAGQSCTRWDRMQYCKRELAKKYPTMSPKFLWNEIDNQTRQSHEV